MKEPPLRGVEGDGLRHRIARVLLDGPLTTRQVWERLNEQEPVELPSLSPRVKELIRYGVVRYEGEATNTTGQRARLLELTTQGIHYLNGGSVSYDATPTRKERVAEIVRIARSITNTSATLDPAGWVALHDQLKQAIKNVDN